MTVCLDETVTITETTCKISVETYNGIHEIAQEFEHWYHYMQTITREFKITTTATATGTSLNKRFNEQNNGSARAL